MEFCHIHDVVTIYGCIVSSYVSGNDSVLAEGRTLLVVLFENSQHSFPFHIPAPAVPEGLYGAVRIVLLD